MKSARFHEICTECMKSARFHEIHTEHMKSGRFHVKYQISQGTMVLFLVLFLDLQFQLFLKVECVCSNYMYLLGQSLLWWFQSLRIICPWPGSSNCPFQNAYLYDCIVCFCHKFCQPSTVKVWWCISSKLHIRHLFYRPEILLQLYCWQLVFKNCLRYVLDLPSMLVQGGRSL